LQLRILPRNDMSDPIMNHDSILVTVIHSYSAKKNKKVKRKHFLKREVVIIVPWPFPVAAPTLEYLDAKRESMFFVQ